MKETKMKNIATIAAVVLIGSSAAAYAQTKPGASGMAPGTQMNSTTNPNPGATRGASELSPGDKMNDARTVGSGSRPGSTKGASELSPGDKMNDKRGK
jgi:hypothetical protein